jgi:hypothetical protein
VIVHNPKEAYTNGNKNFFVIDVSANNDAPIADLKHSLIVECQEYSPEGWPL